MKVTIDDEKGGVAVAEAEPKAPEKVEGKTDKPERPLIDKEARRSWHQEDAGLKTEGKDDVATGNGIVEGYAATWDVDNTMEMFRHGAFAKSIQERVAAGKVKLMTKHYSKGGSTKELVGTVTKMKEDNKGLWFHAEFAGTTLAQDTRRLVNEGHLRSSSIGYAPLKWGFRVVDGKEVLEHIETKIFEVTLTPRPANELAIITKGKAFGDDMHEAFNALVKKLANGGDAGTARGKDQAELQLNTMFGDRLGAEKFAKTIGVLAKSLGTLLSEASPRNAAADAAAAADRRAREITALRLRHRRQVIG